jgi:hypothetical protein
MLGPLGELDRCRADDARPALDQDPSSPQIAIGKQASMRRQNLLNVFLYGFARVRIAYGPLLGSSTSRACMTGARSVSSGVPVACGPPTPRASAIAPSTLPI